jgi:hypothetical protein
MTRAAVLFMALGLLACTPQRSFDPKPAAPEFLDKAQPHPLLAAAVIFDRDVSQPPAMLERDR